MQPLRQWTHTVIGPPRGPVVDLYTRHNCNSYILCPGNKRGGEKETRDT